MKTLRAIMGGLFPMEGAVLEDASFRYSTGQDMSLTGPALQQFCSELVQAINSYEFLKAQVERAEIIQTHQSQAQEGGPTNVVPIRRNEESKGILDDQ